MTSFLLSLLILSILAMFYLLGHKFRTQRKKAIEAMPDATTFITGCGLLYWQPPHQKEASTVKFDINLDYKGLDTMVISRPDASQLLKEIELPPDFQTAVQETLETRDEHPLEVKIKDIIEIANMPGTRIIGNSWHHRYSQDALIKSGPASSDVPAFEEIYVRVSGDIKSLEAEDLANNPEVSLYLQLETSSEYYPVTLTLELVFHDTSSQEEGIIVNDAILIRPATSTLERINERRRSSAI